MAFFNIIIPTVKGRSAELNRAIRSVTNQTYGNWELFVVHDGDKELDATEPEKYDKLRNDSIWHYYLKGKHGAGGARNYAIDDIVVPFCNNRYILFLDDDDVLADEKVLAELGFFIDQNCYPDMVRLGYVKHYVDSGIKKTKLIDPAESDLNVAMLSSRIGPPTKAIKADSRRIPLFLENVKHQDVPQHILACKSCVRCAVWDKPYFIYNIYDRPDKAKFSTESQKALNVIPRELERIKRLYLEDENVQKACNNWIKKITNMYGTEAKL